MNTELEKAKTISLLSVAPVLVFEKTTKTWLVWWNGVAMTAGHAFVLACEYCLNLHSSSEVHRQNDLAMVRVYKSKVLGSDWDSVITEVERHNKRLNPLYRYYLKSHLDTNVVNQFSATEIVKWFDKYIVSESLQGNANIAL